MLRERTGMGLSLGLSLVAAAVCWGPAVRAQDCSSSSCKTARCPPPYVHHQEGPPCIKFKCVCPRPVCPPCTSPFYGYYPTCWRSWPAGVAVCPRCGGVAWAPPGPDAPMPDLPPVPLPEPQPTAPPVIPPAATKAPPGPIMIPKELYLLPPRSSQTIAPASFSLEAENAAPAGSAEEKPSCPPARLRLLPPSYSREDGTPR